VRYLRLSSHYIIETAFVLILTALQNKNSVSKPVFHALSSFSIDLIFPQPMFNFFTPVIGPYFLFHLQIDAFQFDIFYLFIFSQPIIFFLPFVIYFVILPLLSKIHFLSPR